MDNPEGQVTYHNYVVTAGLPTGSGMQNCTRCVFISALL